MVTLVWGGGGGLLLRRSAGLPPQGCSVANTTPWGPSCHQEKGGACVQAPVEGTQSGSGAHGAWGNTDTCWTPPPQGLLLKWGGGGSRGWWVGGSSPCVTFRWVAVALRGPGHSPILHVMGHCTERRSAQGNPPRPVGRSVHVLTFHGSARLHPNPPHACVCLGLGTRRGASGVLMRRFSAGQHWCWWSLRALCTDKAL